MEPFDQYPHAGKQIIGRLEVGNCRHEYRLARQRGDHPAHVWGRMWENGSYPAIRLGEPGDGYLIAVLVLNVTEIDLSEFDRREGVAYGWYRRLRVKTVEGEKVWVYEGVGCLAGREHCPEEWPQMVPGRRGSAEWR